MGKVISQPKLLLVEGKDEVNVFKKLLSDLELREVDVRAVGGRTRFRDRLKVVVEGPGHEILTSIGIVRDADTDPNAAFDSVCSALEAIGLPIPTVPLQSAGKAPRVTVMILPGRGRKGMLEDLCLDSVADDPAMFCVKAYFECLAEQIDELFPNNLAKARVRTFLAAMEWIEEAYFASIQEHLRIRSPDSPSVAYAHTFLASRYKPNLDLGVAARKGYWQLDHPVFTDVRQFLRNL